MLLEDRQIRQLHAAMVGAFTAVLGHLAKVAEEPLELVSGPPIELFLNV